MNRNSLLRLACRVPGVRGAWSRFPVGSIPDRVMYGIWKRPHYAYGVYHAASLAKKLGLGGISVIEFGVAGGNGLIALENVASDMSDYFGVAIQVVGFDAGIGLPPSDDYRDLPHIWGEGDFKMDGAALRNRLRGATKLVLGPVKQTVPAFLSGLQWPVGFIAFDLDYYSSTMDAFQIFKGSTSSRLPRVYCYFDDLVWPEEACHNPYTGEYLAIREFNDLHNGQKICKLANLQWLQPHPAQWHEQMYVAHEFGHPLYTKKLRSTEENQLNLVT
jgi:hypothetical protein